MGPLPRPQRSTTVGESEDGESGDGESGEIEAAWRGEIRVNLWNESQGRRKNEPHAHRLSERQTLGSVGRIGQKRWI